MVSIRTLLLTASIAATLITLSVVSPEAQTRVVNVLGKVFPPDAAPLKYQIYQFLADEPTSLDVSANLYVGHWNEFLFESLLARDENGALIPAAADRWTVSPDGKKWTFYLRKTGKWSDGRPVTANDFVYTFRRALAQETANPYAALYFDIKGARTYNQTARGDASALGVRAPDAYTLIVETEHPAPYMGMILSFPTSMPVPRWQVEKYGAKWTEAGACVTNSSYQLTEWKHGSHMDFELNPYYDGPVKGYVAKIHRVFRHPSSANLLPYENNEVGMAEVGANELVQVQRNPELSGQLSSNPTDGTWYLFFQTRQAPFNDKRVRQAIAHAVDREAICRVVLRGAAEPAYSMLPRTFEAAIDAKSSQAFNPVLAKKLMAEAGFPGGRGFPKVVVWLREAAPETRLVAEAVQSMLQEHLGIGVTFRSADYAVFTSNMFNWNIPMGLVPFYGDYRDPKNMLDMIWRSTERGRTRHDWNNPAFTQLLDQADSEPNTTRRTELYRRAGRLMADEAGAVFIYHPIANTLYKPWLKGLKTNKFGGKTFNVTDVYIGKEYPGAK